MKSFQKPLSFIADSKLYEARNHQIFILLSGFLGAGKTTAVERLAAWLKAQNLDPGIISNDQADGLIDTAIGRQHSRKAVEQVTGGCFCCRAAELGEALSRLAREARPGSMPVRRLHRVAPRAWMSCTLSGAA